MASALHNLSDYDFASVPNAADMRFGIVVSEWTKEENIIVKTVPGSFELIFGSAAFVNSGKVDAVIAIGCVIKGDTPHFDYICQGTTQGLSELNATGKVPVIYGLLTCNTMEQAEERCGGMLGNKGDECAVTAIKMVDYRRNLISL